MDGVTLQQEALPTAYPRAVLSLGGRRNHLDGMIHMASQQPRAGVSNPKHQTPGAAVEEAITLGTGENLRRVKSVHLDPTGQENQETGRKTKENGECLLPDMEVLQLEAVEAGEILHHSAHADPLKAGWASPRMGQIVLVEGGLWALGVVRAL